MCPIFVGSVDSFGKRYEEIKIPLEVLPPLALLLALALPTVVLLPVVVFCCFSFGFFTAVLAALPATPFPPVPAVKLFIGGTAFDDVPPTKPKLAKEGGATDFCFGEGLTLGTAPAA